MAIAGTESAVRSTRQRAAVAALLDGLTEFRSAQEIHDLLRHQGERIGLTTVYRSLQILAASGQIDVLRGPDGEISYRQCSAGHHHHLVCRDCGKTVEIDLPDLEKTAARVARENGFADVAHTLEIFGTCAACSPA
ncbi:MAG TPA: Fur family transcriptional regulator [Kineosporiaceae bacterium]|jgi:Fur family ferric uptake transcriptional regulator|nr:Fur family transcriptional regulator [Kineosporiaceae bacterium]